MTNKVTIEKEICTINGVKIIARSSNGVFDVAYYEAEIAENIIRKALEKDFGKEAIFVKSFTTEISNVAED